MSKGWAGDTDISQSAPNWLVMGAQAPPLPAERTLTDFTPAVPAVFCTETQQGQTRCMCMLHAAGTQEAGLLLDLCKQRMGWELDFVSVGKCRMPAALYRMLAGLYHMESGPSHKRHVYPGLTSGGLRR